MARSTGIVLAAGGVVAANEAVFAPLEGQGTPWKNLNWRIVPATAIMALLLGGLEKVTPGFAVGLAGLVLASVFIVPFGNAPTPLQNLLKIMGYAK